LTSLIFYTDPNQVLLATDTLSISSNSEDPFCYTTKAFIVPHLRMIICGTGCLGFTTKWFAQINDGAIVRDIDQLDLHAARDLQILWSKYVLDFSIPDNITTTIYHFGFSHSSTTIHSFAYRSKNRFFSKTVEYGIGIKPECHIDEDTKLPRDFKKLMELQRKIESEKPEGQRVRIGGEVQVHLLNKNGFNVFTHDKFDDYDFDQSAMFKNFQDSRDLKDTGERTQTCIRFPTSP